MIASAACDETVERPRASCLLHLDDNEQDRFLVHLAIARAQLPIQYRPVSCAGHAFAYLGGEGAFADRLRFLLPDLLLLDLTLPDADCFQVLEWARARVDCANIRRVVLSSHGLRSDIIRAFRLGAASYLKKEVGFPRLIRELRRLLQPGKTLAIGTDLPSYRAIALP